MTHPKKRPLTDPLRLSAPMAEGDLELAMPNRYDLEAELTRAAAELRWALHRQRAAWAKMAKLQAEYRDKPNYQFLDNERPWKLAIGDVSWWRGEVSSRANTIQALLGLLDHDPEV